MSLLKFIPPSPTRIGDPFLPCFMSHISADEKHRVSEAIESSSIAPSAITAQYEEAFARFVGTEHAVALHSSSAGLHLSLVALRIGSGDAVTTSPFTFVGTANPIVHVGAQPLFCDIDPETYNLDPFAVRLFISQKCRWNPLNRTLHYRQTHKQVKAIIAFHYGGNPCSMSELEEIASEFNLVLIEDAAQALGAKYHGRSVGALGALATFSLNAHSNLAPGDGGMVVTNDAALAGRVRMLSLDGLRYENIHHYGSNLSWSYEVEEPGFDYSTTEVTSVIGMMQLAKQNDSIRRRAEIADLYEQRLSSLPFKLPVIKEGTTSAWRVFAVQFLSSFVSRDALVEQLTSFNIGTTVHFIPVHLMDFYKRRWKYHSGDFPIAEGVYDRIMSLPFFPSMKDSDVDRVAEAISTILQKQQILRVS